MLFTCKAFLGICSFGPFLHTIAVKLGEATLKEYQEDGTCKDYQYQKLEYAQILPY